MRTEMNEEDGFLIEARRIRQQIISKGNKYPAEMFCAFCIALMGDTRKEYDEFIEGLDELNEKDKLMILAGMLEKKVDSYFRDFDDAIDFGGRIFYEFDKLRKEKGKKREKRGKRNEARNQISSS